MYKRLFIAATVIFYGAFFEIPAAHALNNDLWIGLCNPCSTTQQFETAAVNLTTSSEKAAKNITPGKTVTYVAIMANVTNSTAYISVTGYWGNASRSGYVFVPVTVIPIDASGNSLASQSETYLENYYTQVDWSVFDLFRSDPTTVTLPTVDFETDTDTDISTAIAAAQSHDVPANTAVTATFNGGGSAGDTAVYIRTSDTNPADKAHWYTWSHVAHNAKDICQMGGLTGGIKVCGGPIDHKGGLLINTNTSGNSGGGANPSPPYYLYPTPVPPGSPSYCTFSSYATDPDGTTFGSTGFGPC